MSHPIRFPTAVNASTRRRPSTMACVLFRRAPTSSMSAASRRVPARVRQRPTRNCAVSSRSSRVWRGKACWCRSTRVGLAWRAPASMPARASSMTCRRGVPVVLMHRRGRSENKYDGPAYGDVVEEVRRFLLDRARASEAAGIARERIALDPGIGFGKSVEENVALIAGAARLADAGYPVLVGSSRKGFIGRLTGIAEPRRRDPASVWLAVEAARRGAAIVRVHDVAAVRQALAVSSAMR